jgi:DNA repair protein RadC
MTTVLGLFNNKLVAFFEDLSATFPEEKEIKMSLEAIQGAKKVNPRLILDMFTEYVKNPLHEHIMNENEEKVIDFAKKAISTQFNEISPALMIFEKHWPSMSDSNRQAIWKHLKVLVLLAEKAKA